MKVFDGMQAKGLARRLLATHERETVEVEGLQKQLLAIGAPAIRPMLEVLPAGPPNPPLLAVLLKLLDDRSLPVFIEALRDTRHLVRDGATAVLEQGRGYDPAPLLALLIDPAYPRPKLEVVLQARVDALDLRTLIPLLTEMPKEARGIVARLLERRVDASAAQELTRLSLHEDHWVRSQCLKLMARIDHPSVVDVAMSLSKDQQPGVRLEAVRCLEAHPSPRAIPSLCARLADPNMTVQAAAIQALISQNDASSVTALLDYLKDESEYVRRAAVEVLNRVVTVEAIKDLVHALRDADWWVRVRAADALGTLGGDPVVEAVIGLLSDEDSFVRRYAVEILNTVPDARAVEPLIGALEDEDWWVRERAIDALAETADARVVEPLLRVLDRDAQAAAVTLKALTRIGDARALDAMALYACSDQAAVRDAAVEGLRAFAKSADADTARTATRALREAGIEERSVRPMEARRGIDPGGARVPPGAPAAATPPSRRADADPPLRPSRAEARAEAPPEAAPSAREAPPTEPPAPQSRATPVDTDRLEPDTLLGRRYRIVRRLGGGGFGTVYLAEDTFVNEQVALKLLAPHLCRDDGMLRRFVEELKLTRRITHRNVIRIHEFLDLDGVRAISMEFFDGRDLGQIVEEERRLGAGRVLDIAEQVLHGLAAAHALGIVHRDIKPANLLVASDGTVKIVDFGLAAVTQSSRKRLTQAGTLVGTPEFIAPELIEGGAVDARSDLYSLGCVLYFALSGQEPFSDETAVKTLYRHLEGAAPPLDRLVPKLPEDVLDLVRRAMARQPDDRPATAEAMLDALGPLRRAA